MGHSQADKVASHLRIVEIASARLREDGLEKPAIGELMLGKSAYYLSAEAKEAFRGYLSEQRERPEFANARSVRNALEFARLRHAYRLTAEPDRPWGKDDLMRLEPSDVLPALSAAPVGGPQGGPPPYPRSARNAPDQPTGSALPAVTNAKNSPLRLSMRCCVPKSTKASPNRFAYPSAHSKLSSSDQAK